MFLFFGGGIEISGFSCAIIFSFAAESSEVQCNGGGGARPHANHSPIVTRMHTLCGTAEKRIRCRTADLAHLHPNCPVCPMCAIFFDACPASRVLALARTS